jgi:hypothetical protein
VAVAGSCLLGGSPARAQDEGDAGGTTLAGYDGTAAASGIRAFYNPSGLLPIAAPVDIGAPDALATIASGPTTFARSSIADPGDLLANPAALLGLVEPSLSGSLPVYPYRVTVSSSIGAPEASVSPVPGLDAHVKADQSGSSADANMPAVDAPAIATVGSLSAHADTSLVGSTVKAHAQTKLAGVDVLGLIHIDAVATDLTATSTDGGATKLEGGTKITGASVLGTPVTIDANGLRTDTAAAKANPLVPTINTLLAQMGLHLSVVSPVELGGESAGQLNAAGLQLDLELSEKTVPAITQLLDLIPPNEPLVPGLPGLEDVLALAKARHLGKLAIGGASVSLTTTAVGPDATPLPGEVPVDLPDVGLPSGDGVALDPIAAPTTPTRRTSTPAEPASVGFGEGIGGLALILLLLQPLLGDRLARWATTMLAADGASACPEEGR